MVGRTQYDELEHGECVKKILILTDLFNNLFFKLWYTENTKNNGYTC